MNMQERLAASRAKINAMKQTVQREEQQVVPEGWVYIREIKGRPHYRTTPGIAVPNKPVNPVADLLARLPQENSKHEVGGTCPHCSGSGRYSAHRGHFTDEKCFRCDGKGILNSKDLAYLRRREAADEPVCRVATA